MINNNENIYSRLKEYLGENSGKLRIMEDVIDLSIQMDYYNISKEIKKVDIEVDIKLLEASLKKESLDEKLLKRAIATLGIMGEVDALRVLENYTPTSTTIIDFCKLAIYESKLIIESKFLEQEQILVTTGLGGKGNLFRYFIALLHTKNEIFNETETRLCKTEILENTKKNEIIVEEFYLNTDTLSFTALIPLEKDIKAIFKEIISICNSYKLILNNNFIVTNVRKLNHDEIIEIFNTSKPTSDEPNQ